MIALYVYSGIDLVLAILFTIRFYREEREGVVITSVLFLVFLLVAPFLATAMIVEKVIIFFRKSPRPIKPEKRKANHKDLVYDKDGKAVSIAEYNKKYQTDFTLADVYGQQYVDALTQEDIDRFENLEDRVEISDNLPMVPENHVVIVSTFAEFILNGNPEIIRNYLTEDLSLFVYSTKETVRGLDSVIKFWRNKAECDKTLITKRTLNVKLCPFTRTIAIEERYDQEHYIESVAKDGGLCRYILLRINDDKIEEMVYTSSYFNNLGLYSKIGLNTPPYKTEIISKGLEKRIDPISDMLPCMQCGRKSEDLKWYSFGIPESQYLTRGKLSICPVCGHQVQYIPVEGRSGGDLVSVDNYDLRSPCLKGKMYLLYFQILKDKDGKYTAHLANDDILNEDDWRFVAKLPNTVKDIIEEFETLRFDLLNEDEKRMLVSAYVQAAADGYHEAYNNLGVYYHHSDDLDRALFYYRKAVENGSKNSMHNLFNLLWNNGQHEEAISFLIECSTISQTSVHCLWNLAYLYLTGENTPNNTLAMDRDKAIEQFSMIPDIESDEGYADNIKKQAKALYEHLSAGELNEYSCKATEYYDVLLNVPHDCGDSSRILMSLNKITCPRRMQLSILPASEQGSGDISRLCLRYGKDTIMDIFRYLDVEKSPMGAWQVYLMHTSPCYLPVFWHGAYNRRTFIYDKHSLKYTPVADYDMDGIDLAPKVQFNLYGGLEEGFTAIVSACYWNDWEGLVREKVEIKRHVTIGTRVKQLGHEVLFEYECGIDF